MKHYLTHKLKAVLLLLLIAAVYTKSAYGQSWRPVSFLPSVQNIAFMACAPNHPEFLYLAAQGNFYFSKDGGKNWKQTLELGSNAQIKDIYFDQTQILLLTSEGIFQSKNLGKNWKKTFDDGKIGKQSIESIAQDPLNPRILYIGTHNGLFKSNDRGNTWTKVSRVLDRHLVHKLAADTENKEVFAATEKGLYRWLPERQKLDHIFNSSVQVTRDENFTEFVDDELNEEMSQMREIKSLIVTASSQIVIATNKGVFVSDDEGSTWQRIPQSELFGSGIRDIIYSKKLNSLFVATREGIYTYDDRNAFWRSLNEGLGTKEINRLVLTTGPTETLYAITNYEAYILFIEPTIISKEIPQDRWNLLMKLFFYEPKIAEVQKKAIQYANVGNGKIKRWQWASRMKTLIPSLSVGKSFTSSNTVDIDRGSTNEPDQYILGPEDTNRGWDFDLDWNLSELIWSSAQTSIDSRDKLTVELRADILNEITRLYHERKRSQIEFILNPAENLLERTNALIRIDELTAQIDGLTEGYFLKKVDEIYREHPELMTLWEITLDN